LLLNSYFINIKDDEQKFFHQVSASIISPVKYQPHKKVERLFFPRYGDPNLYAACGKKHFGPKPSYSTPYAANWGYLIIKEENSNI
jgi:hypothetical protein